DPSVGAGGSTFLHPRGGGGAAVADEGIGAGPVGVEEGAVLVGVAALDGAGGLEGGGGEEAAVFEALDGWTRGGRFGAGGAESSGGNADEPVEHGGPFLVGMEEFRNRNSRRRA